MPPWRITPIAVVLLAVASVCAAADDVQVEAQRDGDAVAFRARATVAAPASLVWSVLTDYNALPRFVPGIARSVVLRRQGSRLTLEQSGEARFLFFSFPIEVRLEVVETPTASIVSRAVAGNVRSMTGRYEIIEDAGAGRSLLRYSGNMEPDFNLPPFIGIAAMRATAEEQFTALIGEIERRAGRAGPAK